MGHKMTAEFAKFGMIDSDSSEDFKEPEQTSETEREAVQEAEAESASVTEDKSCEESSAEHTDTSVNPVNSEMDFFNEFKELEAKLDEYVAYSHRIEGELKKKNREIAHLENKMEQIVWKSESKLLNMVFSQIISMIDDIVNTIQKSKKESAEISYDLLEYYVAVAESILVNNGITVMKANVGDAFNTKFQTAIETFNTDQESLDKTIKEVYTNGYVLGERRLSPAKVSVCLYKKVENPLTEIGDGENKNISEVE